MLGYKKGETQQLCGQMPAHYPAYRVYRHGDVDDDIDIELDNLFKQTTMTPDISVPANGYNFCDYTAPTGYKLISVDMGLNSLAIFCQISKNGGVSRLSFYNAYTNALTLSNPITLTFAKI